MQTWQMAILLGLMYWIFLELTSNVTVHQTANLDDPLLTFDEKYMDDENFRSILRYVNNSEIVDHLTDQALRSDNGVAMENWARFNAEGMRKLCYGEELRIFCGPFINDVRIEGTNTFVLKVIVSLPMSYNRSASFLTSSMGFQGLDTNPAVDDRWKLWVPQMVNFIHLQVPDGMVGGQLQVFEDMKPAERDLDGLSPNGPAHFSEVLANSMHAMRGDAYWTFTDFDVPADGRADHERRRVTVALQQYTLSKASYTETNDILVWQPPEPSIKSALAFGAMLFACAGAAIGVAASQKEQKAGNVTWVVLCVFTGFSIGGGIGLGVTYGLGMAFDQASDLYLFMAEWCQHHYVINPTVTAWFLLTATLTTVWTVVVLGGGWVLRTVAGEDVFDGLSDSLQAMVAGESAVAFKDSYLRKKSKAQKDQATPDDNKTATGKTE